MIADLFCGAGGWGLACTQLGLPHHGYDINGPAVATYTAAGFLASRCDLRSYAVQPCDAVVASPPCQPYSRAGKRQGRTDERGMLALLVPPWAAHARWVAMEQVPGAASVFTRVAAHLVAMGFQVAKYDLCAECYGVPQVRGRIVLMAHRQVRPPKPEPTHSRYYPHTPGRRDAGVANWVTMADALGWGGTRPYPTIAAGTAGGGADADMVGGTGGRAAITRELWAHRRPATTIVGSFQPDTVAAPGYRTTIPRQDAPNSVHVSTAEAGVLQGFPADYPWQGTKTAVRQQIGNAIPPPMAKAVITTLESLCR